MKRLAKTTCLLLLLATAACRLQAQVEHDVFATPHTLSAADKGRLTLDIDNLSFFQNNEFKHMADGYSLPGLWLQPRLTYQPLPNLKMEAGAHILYYSGARRYPTAIYTALPSLDEDEGSRSLHARPFFRVQLSGLSGKLNLILGNLYGGSSHRLVEPLYNPELNLTSDPESGLQVLFQSRVFDADVWLDWKDFIFQDDNHRERFILALSSQFKLTPPDAALHAYVPLQVVAQHLGGEIQEAEHHGVSSTANAAAGIGVRWQARRRVLHELWAEAHFLAYKQLSGDLLPREDGTAWHATAGVNLAKGFSFKAGYQKSHGFISLLGSPYFGSLAATDDHTLYDHAQLLYAKAQYTHRLGHVASLGIDITLYQHFSGHGLAPATGELLPSQSSASILAGIYLRVSPSLLLHRF